MRFIFLLLLTWLFSLELPQTESVAFCLLFEHLDILNTVIPLVRSTTTGGEMGISPSKQVKTTLTSSPKFDEACNSVYSQCLSLTQHAFPGILPYQLTTASNLLHTTLTTDHHHPLITKWVPHPPTQSQVDSALRLVLTQRQLTTGNEEQLVLELEEFKAFGVELFTGAVVDCAGKAVLRRVPIGICGIVGVGVMTRSGKDLVGTVIGVYALGVATSVYLGLSG